MPRWSFGFHQCRYGYKTLAEVQKVVDEFEAEGLPLDTVWMGECNRGGGGDK